MGLIPPPYLCDELEKLDENQRHQLREAVLKALKGSPEINKILRKKTLPLYKKLVGSKGKAARAK